MSPYSVVIKSNLQRYGFFDVVLSGSCMYPILKEGDCARIVAVKKLSLGDICVFENGGNQLLAHRIVRFRGDEVRVKGDHSNAAESIKPESILGIIATVRISNNSKWITFPDNIFYCRIAAFLSRRMIHEQDSSDMAFILKAQRLRRRFYRHILILLNGSKRKEMEHASSSSPQN